MTPGVVALAVGRRKSKIQLTVVYELHPLQADSISSSALYGSVQIRSPTR